MKSRYISIGGLNSAAEHVILTVIKGIHFIWTFLRFVTLLTACCRAFSNWAVTTCFYDLDLLRLGFELPGSMQDLSSNWLRHRRGSFKLNTLYFHGSKGGMKIHRPGENHISHGQFVFTRVNKSLNYTCV